MTNYDLLINRLDAFIRKYYTNQLLKGILLFVTAMLAIVLLLSIGEYFLYFSSAVRYGLLLLSVSAGLYALVAWIFIPLLKTQRLGKVISHEQAATILGQHFPDVQDKLLNVLQLKQQVNDALSRELIEAGIEQKTLALQPIPFQAAVDLARNKKYLPYLLPLLGVFLMLWWMAPQVIRESGERLLSPGRQFKPKAPFDFILDTKQLTVPQYSDCPIALHIQAVPFPIK